MKLCDNESNGKSEEIRTAMNGLRSQKNGQKAIKESARMVPDRM